MSEPTVSTESRSGGASAPVEASKPTAPSTSAFSGLRQFKQRRLPEFDYLGRYAYHLVAVTTNRESLLIDDVAQGVVSALSEAAAATQFELLTFVVMPDHVHLLAMGSADDANAIRFMQRFKQLSGFRYKQLCRRVLWQHSFFDRVLRRDEDPLTVARYILGNPIRAELISADGVWPYQGGTLFVAENQRVTADRVPAGTEAPPLRGPSAIARGDDVSANTEPAGAEAPPLRSQIDEPKAALPREAP